MHHEIQRLHCMNLVYEFGKSETNVLCESESLKKQFEISSHKMF